ncbi:hypothetical protein CLV62_104103 [Dysgonomonas alginatilytica]|uniref:J domain-containing protein n=1 Tax=Dysgonomonas alginatilytica TaxID=1605892 RepID=A0A2V3PYH8_9BACT|nr:LPD29 domain-containing protein [Dysgonomonas alginatilytica]PXV66842.1 hypothetical protein CLV62_104103 [Dysgonomonas alginatilytica]
MKHFSNITSLEDLKSQYKKLALANHPDKGGKTETMQEINNEYDILFSIWKSKLSVKTNETAQSTRSEFYTAWGWKGDNYNSNLRTKDIAKIVREYLKEKYPTYKFSITAPDYNSLDIALLEAPQDVIVYDNLDDCQKKYYNENTLNFDVNYYHISKDDRLTELCREILQDAFDFAQTYNFNDSDAQIDYFHTNFYNGMSIGKWDKPFKVVEKQARIKAERPQKPTEQPEQKAIPENLDIQIIDYSEKAFALIGETKPIKEQLGNLGGKFNKHLKCGEGWIFSKKKHKESINKLLKIKIA